MASFTAPFYGTIQSLSVHPQDNSVWIVTKHPHGRRIDPIRLDPTKLIREKRANTAVETHAFDGVAQGVLGHHTGLYLFDVDGVIYRKEEHGFVAVHACTSEFALQGMVAFRDGGAQNPIIALDEEGDIIPSGIVGQNSQKILLVGAHSVLIVEIAEDGTFEVQHTLDRSQGLSGTISSWAAEVHYEDDSCTYHCAFGSTDGAVSAFFTAGDNVHFTKLGLMNKEEVELTTDQSLHDGSVTAMAYVREIDRYGSTKRYVVSTGSDMKVFQISLLEGMAIPRKNEHAQPVRSFVCGALSSGDGAYRGEKFGRFYSLSNDGIIKAWLNEYTNEALSSSKTEFKMSVGGIIVLNIQHNSGVYSTGDFLGQEIPTPHMVVAGDEEIRFIPLIHTEKSHAQEVDDLRRNGRMKTKTTLSMLGGRSYVQQMGIRHEHASTRSASLERFKNWDALWLIDMLRDIAQNDSYPFDFRERAMDALLASNHPRRIVLLEEMIWRYGNSDVTQKMAFGALNSLVSKGAFSSSLRPHRKVISSGGQENVLNVLNDLALRARGDGSHKREAKQLLQEQIDNSQYDIALRAYDFLSGEGVEEGAIMNGVEGVLYGIFSRHDALRREMMRRLIERGFVDAFETTLILRRLLESNEETIRERALDVSLLRAPMLSNILRQSDATLHQRLYVLEHGSFASTDNKEEILKAALPFSNAEEISKVKRLFLKEDERVQSDIDILVELSSCTKDDIAVYSLQAKASFGFESPVQGLLKLSNSKHEKIVRQAVVGLGYLLHLDDAHQRLCGVTLSKSTPFAIGVISINHAIRGFELRKEDPVQNILRKVLDGGHPKLRETAVFLTQNRIAKRVQKIRSFQASRAEHKENKEEEEKRQELLKKIEEEALESREMLELGRKYENQKMIDTAMGLLRDVNERKEVLVGNRSDISETKSELWRERDLLKTALVEETLHFEVRKQVYRTMHTYNLEDMQLSSDKTSTLLLLLNLRDKDLCSESLKDLSAHIQEVADRDWALALFKRLIDQDITPEHHSNIWSIWSFIAEAAQHKDYEAKVLRIGFDCSAACKCELRRDGSYTVCPRHRIRRDAFLRVLSTSGDWLAQFIRDAISNQGGKNKDNVGESVAVLAMSERAKKSVANMNDPVDFVLSLLSDRNNAKKQRGFACEILMMYPQYYTPAIQEKVYELRSEPEILHMISKVGRLMTEDLYVYFMEKIISGRTELLFKTVTQFATENKRSEEHAKQLMGTGDSRLIRKALLLASQYFDGWGKATLDRALHEDDDIGKLAFHALFARLEREAKRSGSFEDMKSFVLKFYQESTVHRQIWVVETLNMDGDLEAWKVKFLKELCDHKAEEIRSRGFAKIGALEKKEPWIVELLKKGILDPNSLISDVCFQGLLAIHKQLGPQEERAYLSSVVRENKRYQEKAIAFALETTASWRVQFILDALNDEDPMIRSMMCKKMRSVSGLSDTFFQDLLSHKHEEIRELARETLTARGLFRPKSKVQNSLKKTILEEPPSRPKDGYGWISWYWKVQDWKDRKIKAIIAAGNTHNPEYYDVFRSLLKKVGYKTDISNLWSHATYVTSFSKADWHEFIILHTGWVLQETDDVSYAQNEAKKHRDNRMRTAWSVACSRAGKKESLVWLIQQYHDNGWNSFKRFIKREYIFEGIFAVDSTVGFDTNSEGPAFTIMQRLMTDDKTFVNDIFRLNMLRLTHWGGPVDFIGIGYTSSDDQTVLESVQMRALQYDKEVLFEGLLDLINDTDVPIKNPYELANVGGVWYDVVRLTIELHMKTFDKEPSTVPGYWKNIAAMLSCQHPQLRARAVNAYFRRYVHGEEKERFQTDIDNFSRQLTNTVVDSFPLMQDGKRTNKDAAADLAFDGYIGLIRKKDYTLDHRKDALTYMSQLCVRREESARVLPTLKAALVLDKPQIRFQSYQMMIVLQSKDPSLVQLDRLIQMGLRSTDIRLKRMAIALIWSTEQLEQGEKIDRLESILRFNSDVCAELAFELLYAFAGRPSAWDAADFAKETAEKTALEVKNKSIAALQEQIDKVKNSFDEFAEASQQQLQNISDAAAKKNAREALAARRLTKNEETQLLQEKIREAKELYGASIKESNAAHEAKMEAPLGKEDQESWSNAIVRRDSLIQMALDGYCASLRTHAVDKGILELARRRPYFEQSKEEVSGYFARLTDVLRTAIQSSYSDLRRYTALELAKKRFNIGYQVIVNLLSSHDGADQRAAITALLNLGPIGLTDCVGTDGHRLPRTGLILLERVANDEFGTLERSRAFYALGRLKDRHSSIVEELFRFLEKGPISEDFSHAMRALLEITGTNNQILGSTRWADLTPSDYKQIQSYLSHELDWDRVSLDDFVTYYQDVYDEELLGRIMSYVVERGWYKELASHRLIYRAKQTKGFDLSIKEDGTVHSPIHSALIRLSRLPMKKETQQLQSQALRALCNRLDSKETWNPQAQQHTDLIVFALVEYLTTNQALITPDVVHVASTLAKNHCGSSSKSIFDVLYTVASGRIHPVYLRLQAMTALGSLGDERAVLALLNSVGLDAYGEQLLLEDTETEVSAYDIRRLQNAAAEGLGGMIFAQEREGIFQLLNTMSRSTDQDTRRKGFEGLRYFARSEQHVWGVVSMFASGFQGAVNQKKSTTITFFLNLLLRVLNPVGGEENDMNRARSITPQTEESVRTYIRSVFFGESFEQNGEIFNPLNIEHSLFDMEAQHIIESSYAKIRHWVHPKVENDLEVDDVERPIDFSYLQEKTPKERSTALKAERALYENSHVCTKYTNDVTKVLVKYLSTEEMFDLYEHSTDNDYVSSSTTEDRYHILYNALKNQSPPPIKEALNRLQKDYKLDFNGNLPSVSWYTDFVLELLEDEALEVSSHMEQYTETVSSLFAQFNTFCTERNFGDTRYSSHRKAFGSVLIRLLDVGRNLPSHPTLVHTAKSMLSLVPIVEDFQHQQNKYASVFESYLRFGEVDWLFIDTIVQDFSRNLRTMVVEHVTPENARNSLPMVLSWVEQDSAILLRLVDVLNSMKDEVQALVVSVLKDSTSSSSVVLLLTRLNQISGFQTLIDSFRDEEGKISEEVALRSSFTPRSTEDEYAPLLVESLLKGLSLMASEKAEYYLRDLAEDERLAYGVRQVAIQAANVAYRRRVPLHIRRLQRQ